MTKRPEPPPGYVTQSPDTDYWTERAQFEYWASLEPIERVELYRKLCREEFEQRMQRLRELHPNATDEELRWRDAAQRYGRELLRKMTGLDFGPD